MSFSEDFGSAFDQVASPMSKLRQLGPQEGETPTELAAGYLAVVKPGETAAAAATRHKGMLEAAALGAEEWLSRILLGLEDSIIESQQRLPLADAGGILLPSHFAETFVLNDPEQGREPFKLGAVRSLPVGHWARGVLDNDDCYQAKSTPESVPCIFIGEGRVIHIRYSIEVTKKLRRSQRDREESQRREDEQEKSRGIAEWNNSPNGRIAALENLVRDLQGKLLSQPAAG